MVNGHYDSSYDKKNVLIVIADGSYSYDTRMQRIAHTLQTNGYSVFVVCPRRNGDPVRCSDKGIQVRYYASPAPADGIKGHLFEYTYSMLAISTLAIKRLLLNGIDIIHICNPPDCIFPIGLLYRLFGKKFIFDQHDLCPELFIVRFGRNKKLLARLLKLCERLTSRYANHVFVTNDTAAEILVRRTGILPEKVTVLRNVPRLELFPDTNKARSNESKELIYVGYIGNMNPQDGLEYLIQAVYYIQHVKSRNDIHFVCIGNGSAYKEVKELSKKLNVQDIMTFTGQLKPKEAMSILAGCEICVQPDPKNEFNDSCAMAKAFEYMALGKPVVAFSLIETKVIYDEAAIYAENNDYIDFAEKIIWLADNKEIQQQLGMVGRSRIESDLNWSNTEQKLIHTYDQIYGFSSRIDLK